MNFIGGFPITIKDQTLTIRSLEFVKVFVIILFHMASCNIFYSVMYIRTKEFSLSIIVSKTGLGYLDLACLNLASATIPLANIIYCATYYKQIKGLDKINLWMAQISEEMDCTDFAFKCKSLALRRIAVLFWISLFCTLVFMGFCHQYHDVVIPCDEDSVSLDWLFVISAPVTVFLGMSGPLVMGTAFFIYYITFYMIEHFREWSAMLKQLLDTNQSPILTRTCESFASRYEFQTDLETLITNSICRVPNISWNFMYGVFSIVLYF